MKNVPFIIVIVLLSLFSCINDYNPFENKDNIDVKVDASLSSIKSVDTVSIFSTESLSLFPTLYEKIDSFTVFSDGNRLWSDPLKTTRSPKPGNTRFYFSWNDTGSTQIILTVYRSDGEKFSRNYNVYRYSPLKQDSIICELDSQCTFLTPPIKDQGITYHWYFGEFYGRKIEQEFVTAGPRKARILIGHVTGTGSLWVEDTNGNRSPKTNFYYQFTDNKGPTITPVTGKINTSGDTIATGDSIFALRLLVMDNSGIRNVTVNGGAFDDREMTANGEIFTKIFTDITLSTKAHPRADTISATDVSGQDSTRIIYTYFNPDAPRTYAVVLRVLSPSTDTWRTMDSSISIVYRLVNFSSDTVFTVGKCQDASSISKDTVLPGSDKTITWTTPLVSGLNRIMVAAYRSDTIAREILVVDRTKEESDDTIAPVISNILVNGKDGKKHVIDSDKAVLSFLAFDNSGQLEAVTVDSRNVHEVNSQKYRYIDTVQVNHNGSTFEIKAIDSKGHSTTDTVYIRQNSAPSFTGMITRRYITGQKQSDTITTTDTDKDSVSVSVSFTPQGTLISPHFSIKTQSSGKSIISWNGSNNPPLGQYTMTLSLWDGHQLVNYLVPIFITNPGSVDIPAYQIIRNLSLTDTLADGSIDMRNQQSAVRIDIEIKDNLKQLSSGDSIIVENASAVSITNNRNQLSITLKADPSHNPDTVNILVRGSDGIIDTAGRIPVVYSLQFPFHIEDQQYWFALDSFPRHDATVRGANALEWWYNRVSGEKELYSYVTGDEPLFDNHMTPAGIPSLRFGPQNVVLIRDIDGNLDQGGDWPLSPFTAFFVAKRESNMESGALWSSSDYDNVYFALGINSQGNISILNRPVDNDSETIYKSTVAIDTSWNVIMFRSNGCSEACSDISVSMGISGNFSDSLEASASGRSFSMMIGCANKHNGNIPWPGNIAETVCYNRQLSDSECREIYSYLKLKHRLKK